VVSVGGLWLLWLVVSGGGLGRYRERYLELGRGQHTSVLYSTIMAVFVQQAV
jgi:hypothetical protein